MSHSHSRARPGLAAACVLLLSSVAIAPGASAQGKGGGPPPFAGQSGHPGNSHYDEPGPKHGGPGKHGAHNRGDHHRGSGIDLDIGAYFGDRHNRIVGDYYSRQGCPPGLAKKNNGCLPPGQARKRYQLGAPLPSGIDVRYVPDDLRRWLGHPPEGYYYGYVNGDLLLLAEASHRVIDAVVATDAALNTLSD